MSADAIIARLEKVKSTGPGRWIACCPAHEDRSPSLSIRELEDGRVLLHCHAGCGALEILHAVGATWADVFPEKIVSDHRTRRAPPVPYRDLLIALRHEVMVVLLCADAALRHALTQDDAARLALAVSRIETAARFAR